MRKSAQEARQQARGAGLPDDDIERRPATASSRSLTRNRLRGGWFATDDIGRVDAAGRVVVESRRGRIINVAGNKVDPREVELALLGLPGVREAVVVGRQQDTWTQEAWAFLVASDGTPGGPGSPFPGGLPVPAQAAPASRPGRTAAQDRDREGAPGRAARLRGAPGSKEERRE